MAAQSVSAAIERGNVNLSSRQAHKEENGRIKCAQYTPAKNCGLTSGTIGMHIHQAKGLGTLFLLV